MEMKYNTRNPAVKRLMRESIELKDPTTLYTAQPLEDNLFEWHFTIRGPSGSDYEDGVYHGRIILPSEYPMKPPSIALLTPNGRFELGQKICLSASSYHPELWQPSWGIRTMLLALIGFMSTEGEGAIGSLDCSSEDRQRLAKRSLDWVCSVCESRNKTALLSSPPTEEGGSEMPNIKEEMKQIVSQMTIKSEAEVNAQFKKQQLKKSTAENQAIQQGSDTKPVMENKNLSSIAQVATTELNSGEQVAPTEQTISRQTERECSPAPPNSQSTVVPNPQLQFTTPNDSGLRQRSEFVQATPTINSVSTAPTVSNDSSRIVSLVIIIILITFITLLLLRRIFMN